MKFTNQQIYETIASMVSAFQDEKKYIPVKLNFAMQKNLATLTKHQEEIEKSRIAIGQAYGSLDESQQRYIIDESRKKEAEQELQDLFEIEQEVDIKTCPIQTIENLDLTLEQMQAILFMITE